MTTALAEPTTVEATTVEATTVEAQTREDILREINEHELALIRLRHLLPSALKRFFVFRCRPGRRVFIYALSKAEAERKLKARMNQSYGDSWELASQAVDLYEDPNIAASNSPGSLMGALTEDDAREFLKDWKDDQQGRTVKRLKNQGKSTLEHDIEAFERFLRRST